MLLARLRRVMWLSLLGAACTARERPTPPTMALPQFIVRGTPAPLTLTTTSDLVHGRVAGDSAVRLLVRTRTDDAGTARLCGVLAGRVRAPVDLAWGLPLDTAAPRLLWSAIDGRDVQGVRFVVPGERAVWAFEGLTTNGAHRVSLRWPVRGNPSAPVPVGAPDSVIEASLVPRPSALDSLVLGLRDTGVVLATPRLSDSTALTRPVPSRAVPLVSDLPWHHVRLSDACPEATFVIPMIARADQRVRIVVRRGDRIDVSATVEYGAMRLSFDEVALPAPSSPGAIPQASVVAAADGRVTLRVELLTTPKKQRADQAVLLHVARRR
jgi:hypothetical protein